MTDTNNNEATATSTNSRKGKSLTSYKDVQIAYMSGGIEGVRTLHEGSEDGLSRTVLWNAINDMPAAFDTEALRAFAVETRGEENQSGNRGRTAPTVGSTRNYSAQQVKTGGPFLRLPLDTLGAEKSQDMQVSFEDGRIVVTLGASS